MTDRIRTTLLILHLLIFFSLLPACVSDPETDDTPEIIKSAEQLLIKGVEQYNASQYQQAMGFFERALYLYRSIDHPEGVASSCINIARTLVVTGHNEKAGLYLTRAKQRISGNRLQALSDHIAIIESSIAIENRQPDEALQSLEPLLREINAGNSIDIAALQNRVRIALLLDDNSAAHWIEQYQQALTADDHGSAASARLLRFRAELAEQPEQQLQLLEDALAIYRTITHRPGIAATLQQMAAVNIERNDHTRAIDPLKRALFIRVFLKDVENTQKILADLKTVYLETDEQQHIERIDAWLNVLKQENFNRWPELAADFDSYNLL